MFCGWRWHKDRQPSSGLTVFALKHWHSKTRAKKSMLYSYSDLDPS
jgi:hypothetical protein